MRRFFRLTTCVIVLAIASWSRNITANERIRVDVGAAGRREPLTIMIKGTLTGSGVTGIASNKTLLGVGASAAIKKTELGMKEVSNIIIRNLRDCAKITSHFRTP